MIFMDKKASCAWLKNKKITFTTLLCFFLPVVLSADTSFVNTVNKYRNFVSISPEQPLFPLILLLAFLVAVLTFFKPKLGLFVILFSMMISSDLPVSKTAGEVERSTTIRIEDLFILLVSGGWLLNRAKNRSLSIVKSTPVNQAMIMMTIAMLISSLIGIFQATVSFNRAILFTIKRLEYFWLFFMTLNIIDTKVDAKKLLNMALIFAGVIALVGAVQFFLFPASELVGGGATSTVGFGRANSLAGFYLLIIGIISGLLTCSFSKKIYYWYLLTAGITIIALLLTKSRGAFVAFIPLIFTAFIISKDKRILLIISSVLLIWVGYQAFNIVKNPVADFLIKSHYDDIGFQFESIKNVAIKGPKADSSFNARYLAWKDTMPKIFKYPLFGHGVGAMKLGFVDNQYIHELYDTGAIGLLCLLYFNFVIFLTLLKIYKTSRDEFNRGITLGFLSGQVAVLVHGVTITNFYTILNMEAFCFILALIMILYCEEKKSLSANSNISQSQ